MSTMKSKSTIVELTPISITKEASLLTASSFLTLPGKTGFRMRYKICQIREGGVDLVALAAEPIRRASYVFPKRSCWLKFSLRELRKT